MLNTRIQNCTSHPVPTSPASRKLWARCVCGDWYQHTRAVGGKQAPAGSATSVLPSYNSVHYTSLIICYKDTEKVPSPLHIPPWCISHQRGPRTKPSTTALHPRRCLAQGAHQHYIAASEGKENKSGVVLLQGSPEENSTRLLLNQASMGGSPNVR